MGNLFQGYQEVSHIEPGFWSSITKAKSYDHSEGTDADLRKSLEAWRLGTGYRMLLYVPVGQRLDYRIARYPAVE